MGLCKCPKRKVTNLFCFEHRVNVCENCIVANHAKCIVQSYLQWLQDSDYNPNCRLCNALLSNKETVRLVCYVSESESDEEELAQLQVPEASNQEEAIRPPSPQATPSGTGDGNENEKWLNAKILQTDLFHWSCLNEMAHQLPQNTAPAGYQCPSCQGPLFPPTNLVSPVASALREKLSTVNWARAGLRLPLIDETEVTQEVDTHNASDCSDWSSFTVLNSEEAAPQNSASPFAYSAGCNFESAQQQQQQQQNLKNGGVADQHTIVSMSDGGRDVLTINAASSSRKIYDTREAGVGQDSSTTIDFDEDKYRRRPTLSWLAQLLKNRFGTRKQPRSLMQRFVIFLLIGGIGFLTLVIVMMKLGRASADNDPSLDPKFNPHIRVGQ